MHNLKLPVSVLAVALTLSGCTVLQPELPETDAQIQDEWPISPTSDISQAGFDTSRDQDSGYAGQNMADVGWQDFFTDPKLEQLIALALDNNRDLRTAALNVERARALYRIQRSDRFPSVNASGGLTRMGGDGQANVEQYSVDLGITQYEIDLFGRVKNLSDAALNEYLATEESHRSIQLSLVSEVANAYLTLAADLELLRLTESTLESYEEEYQISQRRYELGGISALDLSQSRTIVTSGRAEVALYKGLVAQDKSALGLLVGASVDDGLLPEAFELEISGIDALPAGMPSEALLRRPDVQQAEYQLLAANANIGAARAAFFPSITLTGSFGTLSGEFSNLFEDGTETWSFIPQIKLPIFQGGRLDANLDVSKADRDIAIANYERSIQVGFKEVADALVLSETLAERQTALEDYVDAALETRELSQTRYDAGRDSYLALLDAQRTLFRAQQALVQNALQEQANRVLLYKALGGGWKDNDES